MTTSRIVRGTKARIFLYVTAILIVTGIIACYNNTLTQLEDSRKSNEICHQQEENLSTQLQVISDRKQRLEKSLKTEQGEHQRTKTELQTKLDDERKKNERNSNEANLRFSSLQQHFNLLQTQYDDFKEDCSKSQNRQLSEINDLQSKLNEVQEELKKLESSKENLKSQLLQLQIDKDKEIKEKDSLKKELNELKQKYPNYVDNNKESEQEKFITPTNNKSSVPTVNKEVSRKTENVGNKPPLVSEKSFLMLPKNNSILKSTAANLLKISQGKLNGARPLGVPTVTPKNKQVDNSNLVLPIPYAKRIPEGVVVPQPIGKKTDANAALSNNNEETINNRYRIKISENDDAANEIVDEMQPQQQQRQQNDGYDTLGFGDSNNEHVKNAEKSHFNKQHIDTLGLVAEKNVVNKFYDGVDYKNDVQLENDPEEDDDGDEYGDRLARQKDLAVRN